jgi:hypothetical protein
MRDSESTKHTSGVGSLTLARGFFKPTTAQYSIFLLCNWKTILFSHHYYK